MPKSKRERSRHAVREAVSEAGELRAAVPTRGRPQDPFTGELRRRDVLPLLVLHLIGKGPSYGNQLMERIAGMTEGVLSVNPNTMYPLLRRLEEQGWIDGQWEHPERRTRRYYSLTPEGRAEYGRLVDEVRPFLDSVKASIDEIVREVYGG
ncbi:MAG: PadR family transcriptional regulator [Thermoleophilaceae bacterium]|nr:PadR family transcriptional regulator [Thermoleophilaceae bacterium]